ncbi:hypothetical protein CTAYLR_001329 [Chrysophaeum taylorii]|uniref:Methyltransferase domain-containing protein n=1 Tax=Chrysophaeum taylorii TaxID=2483200 RepID=A0AAD7U620_9STRA|nr:hypothetical protein CTAYLR_001329 [Chrysophaeum taylorii]
MQPLFVATTTLWRTLDVASWPIPRRVAVLENAAISRPSDLSWAGGRGLAAFLASTALVGGKKVVELGAGCGLVSRCCVELGASVVATDYDDQALARVATNGNLEARFFDVFGGEGLPACDVLVASDIMYTSALAAKAGDRAAEALARGATVVFADSQGWAWQTTRERVLAAAPRTWESLINVHHRRATKRVRILVARHDDDVIRDIDIDRGHLVYCDDDDSWAVVATSLLGELHVVPLVPLDDHRLVLDPDVRAPVLLDVDRIGGDLVRR